MKEKRKKVRNWFSKTLDKIGVTEIGRKSSNKRIKGWSFGADVMGIMKVDEANLKDE
jgi:hypothetical protein